MIEASSTADRSGPEEAARSGAVPPTGALPPTSARAADLGAGAPVSGR